MVDMTISSHANWKPVDAALNWGSGISPRAGAFSATRVDIGRGCDQKQTKRAGGKYWAGGDGTRRAGDAITP